MNKSRRSDIDPFVAHRMKELRLGASMTQHQVAQQLGVSDQQVHMFENGKNRVFASQLLAVARLFDVPIADLLNGYDCGAPLSPLVDSENSRMLLKLSRSFLGLEPKHQDALVRLARALAAKG
jgi:transcriptional regulator with XRE-family HTH domain